MHSKGLPPRGLAEMWGLPSRGTRGPRAGRSIAEVAAAGCGIADRAGLEAVTLAAVAAEVGLTTTALYRYVEAKEDLLELMVDQAFGPPPALGPGQWPDRVRAWAGALAERYRLHPWLTGVRVAGVPRRPGLYAWVAALLDALDGAPPELDAMRLALLLDAVVRGFSSFGADPTPPPEWLGPLLVQRHPRLAAELGRDFSDTTDELSAALDVVLRGVQA